MSRNPQQKYCHHCQAARPPRSSTRTTYCWLKHPSCCIVLVAPTQSVAEVIESVRLVGRETGFAKEGQAEAKRLEAGFDKIREVVAKIEEARQEEQQHPTTENGATESAAGKGEGKEEEAASGSGTKKQQKVAFLEWLEPLFNGGHWVPDLVRAAGGLYTMAEPGEKRGKRLQHKIHGDLCVPSLSVDYACACC